MFGIMNILMSFLGVVIGIIFGALPGMTATMAIAVFLPLTYSLDLGQALCLLLGPRPPSQPALTAIPWLPGEKVRGRLRLASRCP